MPATPTVELFVPIPNPSALPDVTVSQKLSVTVPEFVPTSPPTVLAPLAPTTLPVAKLLATEPEFPPTRPPTDVFTETTFPVA